jgi:hypothetical protein
VQDKNAVEKGERFVSLEREQFRCRGATVWIGIAFAPQSAPKVFIGMMANRTLTFDRITTFDPYYFPPGLRFLYIAVVSCVLLIALWFKFVMLGIGGYLLNSVETEPRVGLVIGLLIGAGSRRRSASQAIDLPSDGGAMSDACSQRFAQRQPTHSLQGRQFVSFLIQSDIWDHFRRPVEG